MFGVWNGKKKKRSLCFFEKLGRVCLAHEVWGLEFAVQWAERSSQLGGDSGHAHSVARTNCTRLLIAFP